MSVASRGDRQLVRSGHAVWNCWVVTCPKCLVCVFPAPSRRDSNPIKKSSSNVNALLSYELRSWSILPFLEYLPHGRIQFRHTHGICCDPPCEMFIYMKVKNEIVRFEVLSAFAMKNVVLWDV
jgi:hypothetical protein